MGTSNRYAQQLREFIWFPDPCSMRYYGRNGQSESHDLKDVRMVMKRFNIHSELSKSIKTDSFKIMSHKNASKEIKN